MFEPNKNPLKGERTTTKEWSIKDLKLKEKFRFLPMFEVNLEDEVIETRYVQIKVNDKEYLFNFLDLFMFVYFCSNEELRRSLSMRKEASKRVNYIPYEVTIKLGKDEIDSGIAKRRLEVPIDSLIMAIARHEAAKTRQFREAIKGRN